MKNYEKYADKIREFNGISFCNQFVTPYILKTKNFNCGDMPCDLCHMLQMLWLLEDYKEPGVDWSEVEVDTPILVRDDENKEWNKRYFAKYEDGKVYAWGCGCTSWNAEGHTNIWNFAKLAESEEE